jgi:Eco47II restriction endonuclease
MSNKYLAYISDEHFLNAVMNLHKAYVAAAKKVTLNGFYENKVDSVKLIFDAKFHQFKDSELIKNEVFRQIDKSINNAIGTFHEQILGGIEGYEKGNNSGFDIRALDRTLFADIKNKHNTMNSSAAESLFQKLKAFADQNKKAKCYWVQIWAKSSFNESWKGVINGKEYSHSRVYKISGDQFYSLLTGRENALFELYKALPQAIDAYLKSSEIESTAKSSVESELKERQLDSNRSLFDQITFDNYLYYSGFNEL